MPEEDFWQSSLSKVLYVIKKSTEEEIENKNFEIGLFKSIGARGLNFIKLNNKENKSKDVYVDSFDDML